MAKTRNSSFELLRLFCMLSIVFYHILSHRINDISGKLWFYTASSIFFHFGTVVFVLISGWFGLKLTLKRILSIYIPLFIYTVGIYLFAGYFGFQRGVIYDILLLKDGNALWFIQPYISLCLLSPLINKMIEGNSRKDFTIALSLLAIFVFIFGWIGDYMVAKQGKTVVCFIFLYVIGRFLKSESDFIKNIPKIRGKILMSILFIALIIYGGKLSGVALLEKISGSFFAYNSPGLILLSVLILLLFSTFSIQSRAINFIASSSFSIFLIPSQHSVDYYIYNLAENIYNSSNIQLLVATEIILLAIVVCLACITIDILVRHIITNPLVRFLCHIAENS